MARRYLPWAGLAVCMAAIVVAGARSTWAPDWDSALYLLTARSMAEGGGYSYLGEPFFLRPPGFSWLLSWFFVGGQIDPAVAMTLVAMLAGLSLAAVFVLVHRERGPRFALAVTALTASHPLYVRDLRRVLSEYPFVALLLAAVVLLERSLRSPRRWWSWCLAGTLCLVAATYVRTAALLVLPGLIVSVLLGRRSAGAPDGSRPWRPVVLTWIGTLALALPWWLHAGEAASTSTVPAEQLLLHDYKTALLHTDPGDPSSPLVSIEGWNERVATNAPVLLKRLAVTTLPLGGIAASVVLALLLAAACHARLRDGLPLVDCWVWAYALLLIVYFTFARRLLLPLVPVVELHLLITAQIGAGWLGERFSRPRLAAWGVGLATLVLLSTNVAALHRRYGPEAAPPPEVARFADAERVAAWLVEHTPKDAVVLASNAPVLRLLTGRDVVTYRFARRPPGELLDVARVDYVVFDDEARRDLQRVVIGRAARSWTLPSARPDTVIPVHRLEKR